MGEHELKIRKANKTALLFGATGLVGSFCLQFLIEDPNYNKIIVFNRTPQNYKLPGVEEVIINYDKIHESEENIVGDDVFISLGTTMAKAGSKKAFIKVDYTYVMKAALSALRNGANQLVVVSAAGSDKDSYIFYNRVKGELENDLSKLDYWAIHILKPSLIIGHRKEVRKVEKAASRIAMGIDRIFGAKLASYRPVTAKHIARAMTNLAGRIVPGVHFYNSNTIVEIGNNQI